MTIFEVFNKRSDKFAHLFNKEQLLLNSQRREIVKIIEESSLSVSLFYWSRMEILKSSDYGVIV